MISYNSNIFIEIIYKQSVNTQLIVRTLSSRHYFGNCELVLSFRWVVALNRHVIIGSKNKSVFISGISNRLTVIFFHKK